MSVALRQLGWLAAAIALAAPRQASAQDLYLGTGLGTFVGGGRGVANNCLEYSSRTGPFIVVGRRVWRELMALQATTHVHAWRQEPECVVTPGPPHDGTFTRLASPAVLESRFATTDLRMRLTATASVIGGSVTLGGGVAWRAGPNVPYLAAGAAIAAPFGPCRFVVEGELYRMRVQLDYVERTYENFQLVSVVPLPTIREWNSAGRVAVGVLIPVKF